MESSEKVESPKDALPVGVADRQLSVPEAAAVLRMSTDWVYRQVSKGVLPHRRMGGRSIRFSERELLEWAAKQGSNPTGEAH